jgi:hypothetical protein
MHDVKVRLSMLWVFVLFNFLYADVMALFDAGLPQGVMTAEALLAASFLMEIPIAMIVLSRVLRPRPNRWANMIAGAVMAIVQAASLFVGGGPTGYYVFFSAIEIPCLLFIVWTAWRWPEPAAAVSSITSAA